MLDRNWWASLTSRLEGVVGDSSWPTEKLVVTFLLIAGAWLVRRLVLRSVDRRVDGPSIVYRWRKGSLCSAVPIVALLLTVVWSQPAAVAAGELGHGH